MEEREKFTLFFMRMSTDPLTSLNGEYTVEILERLMDFFSLPFTAVFALVSVVFLFGLGALVFSRDVDNSLYRLFALICIVFMVWMFGSFMMFVGDAFGSDDAWIIFWDRFVYVGVVFMPALQYHFSLLFSERRLGRLGYVAYLLSFVFLFLSRSDFFISDLFRYEWGVHTFAGPLHHVFLAFFFFYIFALLRVLVKQLWFSTQRENRMRTLFAIVAFAVLNLLGGTGYLPAYGISVFPIFLVAPSLFAIIITYSVIKYRFLEIKTFVAQVLVGIMLMLNGVQLLVSNTLTYFILNLIVFLFIVAVGYFLVRSVKRDIERKDELQKISNSLAVANERLKELDNTKSEFISIASHQLRTPLTAIKGYLSLALEGSYGTVSSEIRDVLEKIYAANGNLIKLVEDLLNVSRIETGRMQYRFEAAQIEALVAEQADMFLPLAKDRGLDLRIRLPKKSLPKIDIDTGKIREAVANVIDNAIKYTPRGSVTVSVEAGPSSVTITVSDTGVGIRPDELDNLFRKFVRSEETTKVSVSGTGLGLYVGRNFVEAHGGRMWAESEGIGKGSSFFIEIPFHGPKTSGSRKMR